MITNEMSSSHHVTTQVIEVPANTNVAVISTIFFFRPDRAPHGEMLTNEMSSSNHVTTQVIEVPANTNVAVLIGSEMHTIHM